jgi:glycolate oxidase
VSGTGSKPAGRIEQLCSLISNIEFSVSNEVLNQFSKDESQLPAMLPEIVVFPKSTQEVSALLKAAYALNIPIVPVGARTGKSGGSLCTQGGVALSLEKMNRVLNVNVINRTLTAQPGVVLDDLKSKAESAGLWYPPDPNSSYSCTLGGTIATNAGGPSALKYGVTGDYVLSMEWVTPQGEVLRVGRKTAKGVVGYDLVHLLVGSEGTLGVCTEVTVQLIPKPKEVVTALFQFASVALAIEFVTKAMGQGAFPRCLELIDDVALSVSAWPGIQSETGAVIIAESDGFHLDSVLAEMNLLRTLALEIGSSEPVVAQNESQRASIWNMRKCISIELKKLKGLKFSEDIVIPIDRLSQAVAEIKKLGERHQFTVATYGHAGDGNLHTNVLFGHTDEWPKVEVLLREIMELTVRLGGTISGEHGVGLSKREFLQLEQSPQLIDIQREIRRMFDPEGLMNPGKIFEL